MRDAHRGGERNGKKDYRWKITNRGSDLGNFHRYQLCIYMKKIDLLETIVYYSGEHGDPVSCESKYARGYQL
jgi:hypothetical protein